MFLVCLALTSRLVHLSWLFLSVVMHQCNVHCCDFTDFTDKSEQVGASGSSEGPAHWGPD